MIGESSIDRRVGEGSVFVTSDVKVVRETSGASADVFELSSGVISSRGVCKIGSTMPASNFG